MRFSIIKRIQKLKLGVLKLQLKKTEILGFKYTILLSFEVFATQLNLVTRGIALRLKIFVIRSLQKFLSVMENLLTSGY